MQDLDGEADRASQDDGGERGPFDRQRYQESIEAEAQGDEADNVLKHGAPIAPGHAELGPKRFESYFLLDFVPFRNPQVHAGSSLVPDDVSAAFVKKVQREIAFILGDFGRPVCRQET